MQDHRPLKILRPPEILRQHSSLAVGPGKMVDNEVCARGRQRRSE